MSKGDSNLFDNTIGDNTTDLDEFSNTINQRTASLDTNQHPVTNKILNSTQMKQLEIKINNRTATYEEYKIYMWNKRISKRRAKGVKSFWNQERQRIKKNEPTTREWTKDQIDDILNGKVPKYNGKPLEGHHTFSVSLYPHLANEGAIVFPATHYEHYRGWHGGNYKTSSPGKPIKYIREF